VAASCRGWDHGLISRNRPAPLEDIYDQRQFEDCVGFGAHPIDTDPRPEWLNDPETACPPLSILKIAITAGMLARSSLREGRDRDANPIPRMR